MKLKKVTPGRMLHFENENLYGLPLWSDQDYEEAMYVGKFNGGLALVVACVSKDNVYVIAPNTSGWTSEAQIARACKFV